MFTYEPGNRISVPLEAEGEDIDRAALTAANEDALSFARDVFESQRDQLNQLHAEWYNQIIFAHGNQDHAIDTVTGTPVRLPQKAYRTYDFTLPILQRVISKLGSVPTKREAHATTTDTTDIEAARTATDILSWAHEHFHFDELNAERLDWKVKTGNSIVYLPWMPNEGPTDQETGRPAGMPQMIVDPGFHWMWDPRATHYRRADYAARMTLQPEEWVERNFPDTYHLVPKNYYNEAYSSDFFQLALMGMNGSRSSYGLTQMNLPKGKGLVRIFEFFVKPCPRYPQGQLIVCAGTSGGPGVVLHSDINVYGTIPAIHFGMIRVTGRFWFDSITQYLMDPQTEVNHRVRQISRTAARTFSDFTRSTNSFSSRRRGPKNIEGTKRTPGQTSQPSPSGTNPPTATDDNGCPRHHQPPHLGTPIRPTRPPRPTHHPRPQITVTPQLGESSNHQPRHHRRMVAGPLSQPRNRHRSRKNQRPPLVVRRRHRHARARRARRVGRTVRHLRLDATPHRRSRHRGRRNPPVVHRARRDP
jgi:hypothetical protein